MENNNEELIKKKIKSIEQAFLDVAYRGKSKEEALKNNGLIITGDDGWTESYEIHYKHNIG